MAPLPDALNTLGLHHTAGHLDDLIALATKRRWSPTQRLEHLVDREQQERARRSFDRRLLRSRLGRFTPMEAFDWAGPTRLDRAAGRNLVLVAAQGLGKTMIAQNIAHQAILAGQPPPPRRRAHPEGPPDQADFVIARRRSNIAHFRESSNTWARATSSRPAATSWPRA